MLIINSIIKEIRKFEKETGKKPECVLLGSRAYLVLCCEIKELDEELFSSENIIEFVLIQNVPCKEHCILEKDFMMIFNPSTIFKEL